MTPPIIIELGFRGVIIPQDAITARVICPECSPTRHKQHRRTLRVLLISDTEADLRCMFPDCSHQERVNA